MKKYLPLILLGIGILVIVGAFLFVRGRKVGESEEPEEEIALLDVALNERPIVSLTPSEDGHYLYLNIDKITIDAASLDYELLYKTEDGVLQGVPGTVDVKAKDNFEADILLGSESSGKFRYDEGVEEGTISLKFRNSQGKLLAKFESEFHMQTSTDLLTSIDKVFNYELEKESEEFFVAMSTVGYPGESPSDVETGPYGIFSSSPQKVSGTVDLGFDNVYYWDGNNWQKLFENRSSDIGIFFGSTQ